MLLKCNKNQQDLAGNRLNPDEVKSGGLRRFFLLPSTIGCGRGDLHRRAHFRGGVSPAVHQYIGCGLPRWCAIMA
jgi:hypothetical protein